ncbi:prepilin-type N-terminal cleavage/methylation domain-containing protein [Patescibacteria group bacterium]|nr:prepilin-type N-terminal cleavage/methylation domain-containing protein [Patescibacteria group bacterium]
MYKNHRDKGTTLIEILVAITIIGIVFVAIFAIFRMVIQSSAISEARTTATGLANQQMEMIHNLPYNDIATTSGWPQGDIPSTKTEVLNNITFTINTNVNYVDNPFDDTVPIDTLGADYKKVKVEVSWDKFYSGTPVILHTDISSRGIEETEQPGGVLYIKVFDANNQPVAGANIQVVNNDLSLNFSDTTNNAGERVFYALTPDSGANYEILVTKGGYTTDYTSEITPEMPDPDNPHRSIFEGQVETASFTIDIVSSLTINTQDDSDPPSSLANIPLTITGERRLGLGSENELVPRNKFEGQQTDGSGQLTLSNIEWDSYNITEEDANYDIAEINPPNPTNVAPNENLTTILTLVSHAAHTLRVVVSDNNDNPLADTSVRLYGNGFDETKQTSAVGQVFFTPLQQATYNLEITKSGYISFSDTSEVEEQTVREVVMATQS